MFYRDEEGTAERSVYRDEETRVNNKKIFFQNMSCIFIRSETSQTTQVQRVSITIIIQQML